MSHGQQYDHPIPVEGRIDTEPERLALDQLIASLRPSWMAKGACVGTDPDAFFPPPGPKTDRDAKAICATCPVVDTCLEYALTNHLDGVWGNPNGRERKRLRPAAKRKPGPPPAPITNHGTQAGYQAHRRRAEDACPECLAAWSRRSADQRSARRMAVAS